MSSAAVPAVIQAVEPLKSGDRWLPLSAGAGPLSARLWNGVFGDPLLEVRLRDRRDRLLFDLGDAAALSRRVLHRVSDVFITHAHFDHICGFLDLLRARMTGPFPPCRLYGPPNIQTHIAAFVGGICWDRIEAAGPEFRVGEVYGTHVRWWRVKVGQGMRPLHTQPIANGLILAREDYEVRTAVLDHGIPVLCYAVEAASAHHVRVDRLEAMNLRPGPWIRDLKRALRAGHGDARIRLSSDRVASAGWLQEALLETVPGKKLIYATDFADTPDNRAILTALSGDAELMFCEATFCEADSGQANATQHLTTRACGEIARAAKVRRLVPFHFSKRYTDQVSRVYAEIRSSLEPGSGVPAGWGPATDPAS